MNHLEAQSYIMPFIEGKLPESEQLDFVMHMNNCKACHDELEIYYTLMTGMQVLSDGEESSGNFGKDLSVKLKKIEHKAKGRRSVRLSAFMLVTIAISIFMILFYGRCLVAVYAFEQNTKKEAQGEYYFSRKLDPILLKIDDRIRIGKEEQVEEKKASERPEIYNKIHGYRELEEFAATTLELGEKIANEKTTVD